MEYRHLGSSGLQVSALSFGSWVTFSTQIGEEVAYDCMQAAYDAGVNFFDNAEVYAAGASEVMNIIGEVDGRSCILVDDICDSGGTLCNAAEALLDKGAKDVSAYVTHGVLSGGAVARITQSVLKELVICDSIQPSEHVQAAHNIRVLPIAPLIGEAMRRISNEESVSSLFNSPQRI